jgi:glycosyltransferase involved in cell wall biosynthesis
MPVPRARLLYVGPLPPVWGGTAVLFGQILDGLADRGFAVEALSFSTSDLIEDRRPSGIRVRRYGETFTPGPDYIRMRSDGIRAYLPDLIREVRPDLVIVGAETFMPGVCSVAKEHDLPCLGVVHNVLCSALDGAYPASVLELLVPPLHYAVRLVAVAAHIGERLEKLGLASTIVIPNFVDTNRFAPRSSDNKLRQSLGFGASDIIGLHVSNLKDVKRPMDLIRSAALAIGRNERLRYLVVGDGPNRQEMVQRCCELGIQEQVRFTGWVSHEQLPSYFNLADMVVVPSETEAMALVFLEAMSSGCVLIASDIPATRELVRDGETGVLVKKGDIEALAEKTLTVAEDPGLRELIGANSRRHVVANHERGLAIDAFADVIDEAIASRLA